MKYLLPFLACALSALSLPAQYIGIGTKTPEFPLDIAGTTRVHSNLIAGDSGTLSSKVSIVGVLTSGGTAGNFSVDSLGQLRFSGLGGYRVKADKYAIQCDAMPSEGLFMNGDLERWEFRDDKANPYFTINDISKTISVQGGMNAGIGADQFKVDAKGHLTFSGESGIYIDHNKYAILCNDMPAEGLFMNGDLERWEFRDENGSSFFHAGGANYDIGVRGGVQLGNTTSIQAGMMRFKGGEFQGYNGTEWRSFNTVKASNQSAGNSTVLQELETLRLQVENLSQQLEKLQATQ